MFKAKHLVLILGAAMGFSAGTALALVSKTPPSVNTTVVGAPASTATFNKDGSITIKSSNFKIGVFSTATANSVIKDPSKLKSITGNIVTVQSPKGGFSIIFYNAPASTAQAAAATLYSCNVGNNVVHCNPVGQAQKNATG